MGKKDLEKFIADKKKTQEKVKEINWTKKRDEWLEKLNKLYKDIESWLNDLEQDMISINYVDKEINEEYIGSYTAPKMILQIADEQVVLDPIGTLLIGAAGRVDMTGKNGQVKLVLVPSSATGARIKIEIKTSEDSEEAKESNGNDNEEMVWKIATPPPSIKYIELDSDSFSDALLEVIGE